MSVYNAAPYLKEAVDSILNQTFGDFEFLIVDDRSTDNSIKILETYEDERIVLFQNHKNIGLTRNLNKLIKLAKGEFIARMDADDISLPMRFEKQIKFLVNNLDIDLCGTQIGVFGNDKSNSSYPINFDDIKFQLMYQNPIAHPSVVWRKKALLSNHLFYDENYITSQDFELWTRCALNLKMSNLNEILVHYRTHNNQISILKNENQRNAALSIKLKYLNSLGFEIPLERNIEFECFFDNGFKTNSNDKILKKVDDFAHSLYLRNLDLNIFNQSNLIEYWENIFWGSKFTRYDLRMLKVINSSKIHMIHRVQTTKKLKLTVKCLLSWQVKNNIR